MIRKRIFPRPRSQTVSTGEGRENLNLRKPADLVMAILFKAIKDLKEVIDQHSAILKLSFAKGLQIA